MKKAKKTAKGFALAAAFAAVFYLSYRLAVEPAVPGRSMFHAGTPGPDVSAGLERGAVNVPAAMLWKEPGRVREYDDLILQEKNDPAAWAGGMDSNMRLWLVGKAETMVLYGEPVVILDRRGEWLKVAAMDQKTSLNEYGYPGWVPAVQVARSGIYIKELENLPSVVVSKKTSRLYSNPDLSGDVGEVSYMTRLPLLEERGRAAMVRLPDGGTGYFDRNDIKKSRELAFSREGIVNEARQFLGLPYLWAGTASYGFDCSGFTMRLYQSQGVSIPRDADEQAAAGMKISRQDLQPGDLVFFAANNGSGQIHHVGLYIGGGMMIHSPNSKSSVRIDAVDSGSYGKEYWGARRYAVN